MKVASVILEIGIIIALGILLYKVPWEGIVTQVKGLDWMTGLTYLGYILSSVGFILFYVGLRLEEKIREGWYIWLFGMGLTFFLPGFTLILGGGTCDKLAGLLGPFVVIILALLPYSDKTGE